MKAKVLITGSSGFIGKILTKKLSKEIKKACAKLPFNFYIIEEKTPILETSN